MLNIILVFLSVTVSNCYGGGGGGSVNSWCIWWWWHFSASGAIGCDGVLGNCVMVVMVCWWIYTKFTCLAHCKYVCACLWACLCVVNRLQLRHLALFLWLVYVFICYFSLYALLVDVIYSHEIMPSQMGFLEFF